MFNILRVDNGSVVGRRETFAEAVAWIGPDADYYAVAEVVLPHTVSLMKATGHYGGRAVEARSASPLHDVLVHNDATAFAVLRMSQFV